MTDDTANPGEVQVPVDAVAQAATGNVTIFVCTNCRDAEERDRRPGVPLIAALRDRLSDGSIAVKPVTCLGNCDRGPTVAFRHASGWSYVFGHLGTEQAEEIVAGAKMLCDDPRGLLPLRGRPACLRGKGMTARIPPFDHHEDMPA